MIRLTSFRIPRTRVYLTRRGVSFPVFPFIRAFADWPGRRRRRRR